MRPIRAPFGHRRRRGFALATLAVLAIAVACQDVTQPSPVRRLSASGPRHTAIVTPANMQGWVFYDDQHDTLCTVTTVCQMVQGPVSPPLGTGSAELATPTASDGKALVFAGYGGTRFDSITDLHYSTYRQTSDPGNNLAISLQFNADYDLTDTAHAYQGRVVFEPYQGNGGNVPQNAWQTWDARAGKWWGSKSSVWKSGTLVTNPCVQASPCTWTQLLTAFPNIGVHATLGALVLKAGSSWAGFRGNVDQFAIGIGGATTVFDFEQHAPPVHLHTSIPAAVAGTRLPADSDYAPGTVINYSFSPGAGHDSLVVVLDDTVASASGTIVMDNPHTLETDADTIIVPSAAVVDLESRVAALLTAPDMRAAYSDFLQWYIDRSKVIGRDSLRVQLELASQLAVDPYRDSARLGAFDDAMAGVVSVIDHFGGVDYTYYYEPEDYGGGVVANSVRAGRPVRVTGAHAGTHRVPPALLSKRRAKSVAQRNSAAEMDFPTWTREQIAIFYINGIGTPNVSNSPAVTSAFGTTDILRDIVFKIPGVSDQGGSSGNVEVTHFYNRNLRAQLAPYDSAHACIARAMLRWNVLSALVAGVKYAACKGQRYAKVAIENDISESAIEYARRRDSVHTSSVEDVGNLARVLNYWHDTLNYHTILVTHSQGNMLAELAERMLPDIEHRPLEARHCTAQLTMASPLLMADFHLDHNYLRGFDINGDILEVIGFKNDFPHFDTDTSVAGAAAISQAISIVNPFAPLAAKVKWGATIHGVDYNYFTYQPSIARIQSLLGELKDECVVGSIQVAPSSVIVPLGDSLKVADTVRSAAGHVLVDRSVEGGGVHAELRSDSTILASAPTSGAEIVPVRLASTGDAWGQVSVTVPPVPFTGTVRQYFTSIWVWAAEHSQNDSTSGDPPFPSQSPSWDGTPADCNKTTRTTAGTSWKDWAQQCGRGYVVDVPADPMPVRTKLRIQFANYPGQDFSQGSAFDSLLVAGVPVTDTVATCNQTYCFTAAAVQSLNSSNVVMTSDTVCLSDACGASQNRFRIPMKVTPQTNVRPSTGSVPRPISSPHVARSDSISLRHPPFSPSHP